MNRNGFSFVELVTVIAIAGILMAIATLYFNQMTVKSGIEGEIKTLYADLATARLQALYQKRGRSVVITAGTFSVYTSAVATDTKLFKYAVTPANLRIYFSTSGVATFNNDSTAQNAVVCVQPTNNSAAYDSIALNLMQIQMGKLTGTGCTYGNVSLK